MRCAVLLLTLLVWFLPSAAAPETVSLRYYEGYPPRGRQAVQVGSSQHLTISPQRPEGIRRLPQCVSKKLLYGTAVLGTAGRAPLIVLDESRGTGTRYDTVYVDCNLNGDFTDDVYTQRRLRPGYVPGTPLCLQIPVGSRRMPYYAVISDKYGGYTLGARGHCVGDALFGKRRCRIAVIDANANGRFGDVEAGPLHRRDVLLVDLNGTGRFDSRDGDTAHWWMGREAFYCGRHVIVDGQCYDLSSAPDRWQIRLAPTKARLGLLKSDRPAVDMALEGKDSRFWLRVTPAGIRVPAGTYRVAAWQTRQRDTKGRVSTLGDNYDIRGVADIVVRAGGTTSFGLGDTTLRARVHARAPGKGAPGTIFEVVIHTSTGRKVDSIGFPPGSGVGNEPAFLFPDPGGDIVTPAGRFRRVWWPIALADVRDPGGKTLATVRCTHREAIDQWKGEWRAPVALKGRRLKVAVRFDHWPIPVRPASCSFTAR